MVGVRHNEWWSAAWRMEAIQLSRSASDDALNHHTFWPGVSTRNSELLGFLSCGATIVYLFRFLVAKTNVKGQ